MRSFNTAGPVKPDRALPASRRFRASIWTQCFALVRRQRSTSCCMRRDRRGKTSALLALAEVLNERGYRCIYSTVETARTARDDVQRAMRVVLATLAEAAHAVVR